MGDKFNLAECLRSVWEAIIDIPAAIPRMVSCYYRNERWMCCRGGVRRWVLQQFQTGLICKATPSPLGDNNRSNNNPLLLQPLL